MTSTQQKPLSSNRVCGPPSVDAEFLECYMCHNVLWKPVACQTCETPFCSTCINQWLANKPNNCPNQCEKYTERKCPPFIAKLLAQLEINCSYQSNGCDQVLLYETLEKHEVECDYQSQQCPGCQSQILKKDFDNHKSSCTLIDLTCQECKLVYKQGDADTKHTENICLKEQVRQMREHAKKNQLEIQELARQLNQIRTISPVSKKLTITFADLPSALEQSKYIPTIYKGFEWTKFFYVHGSYMKKHYPKSGYVSCFTSGVGPHIAFFKDDASLSTEKTDEIFTIISLNACSAWFDDLQLVITAYRKSIQVSTHTSTLLFGKPQCIPLEWNNIDKINFKSLGGVLHPGSGTKTNSTQVVITQLRIG